MSESPKKIIVWSWSRDPSIIPVEKLVDEGKVDVVMWVSMWGGKTFHTKEFSYVPAKMLHAMALNEKRSDVFYKQSADQLYDDLNHFLDIYSRVNYSKGRDYHDQVNLFHLYYQYFTDLLISNDVEAVVYFGTPHVGVDYILYLVAKALGIEVIMTMQSFVPNRFFCFKDFSDFGVFKFSKKFGVPVKLDIPKTHEKPHFYMARIKNKRTFRVHKFIEDCLRAAIPSRQPITWTGVWQNMSARINFMRSYRKVVQHSVDYNRKYVYFPLQLQPELTTSILGNEFSDQLLAIERLSSILPDDWCIYVKENPKQGFQQRNTYFYERLKRIPNCSYLSERVNTYDLIKKSKFVASITGTACWEAVSGGKPALIFGRVWFMTLPGITVYRQGVSLDEIMNKVFSHKQLEDAYSELLGSSIPGIIGVAYSVLYDEYNEENNAELLLDFLRKVLKL